MTEEAGMAKISLEKRVAVLEAEVARLKARLTEEAPPRVAPWWERIYGTFENDPLYEEALGRAYRESLRPRGDEPERE
jgi:hypothetical protein